MTHLERTDTARIEKVDPPKDMLWDERWGIRKTVYGWLKLPSGQHQMITSPVDWEALETALALDPEAVRLVIRERDSLARRCALRFEETEVARATARYAEAERDAMRPVVEAARAWRATFVNTAPADWDELGHALIAAVDALDGAS